MIAFLICSCDCSYVYNSWNIKKSVYLERRKAVTHRKSSGPYAKNYHEKIPSIIYETR